MLEWDEAKRKANLAKHGVDFVEMARFDWDSAAITIDRRRDYGEVRERAAGFVGHTLCVAVFTRRAGAIRVISLRPANRKEARKYGDEP